MYEVKYLSLGMDMFGQLKIFDHSKLARPSVEKVGYIVLFCHDDVALLDFSFGSSNAQFSSFDRSTVQVRHELAFRLHPQMQCFACRRYPQ